ncbi:MAG TPA: SBBP repeat-containing protein [Bryobacteraceae bacterium]|jgi:uncharacterized protein (TIGR03437 family)
MSNGAILTYGGTSLAILDASGNQISSLPATALGTGQTYISGEAFDQAGNIWIFGQTDAAGFPLVHPLYSQAGAANPNPFVAKLSPDLKILFSTFLEGQPAKGLTIPYALALDGSGNAYITGDTQDSAFPVTGEIFGVPNAYATDTFITEIAADGSQLIYSRLLGGSSPYCPQAGSSCFTSNPVTIPSAMDVDKAGNVVIAGTTHASDFPVTITLYPSGGKAFVTRIAAGGQKMTWSTLVPQTVQFYASVFPAVQGVAFDPSGNVIVAGTAIGPITGTPNSLQPTAATQQLPTTGFVLKLSADGTQVIYATNLGGAQASRLSGIKFDSAGNLWAAGFTSAPDFPGISNVPPSGVDFALELNSDGSGLKQVFSFLPNTATQFIGFDSDGRLLLLGSTGNLLRWNPDPAATTSAIFALTNSALPSSMSGASPGELATIYGVGLGPATGIAAAPDANGLYPTTLGGVSVGFTVGTTVIPAPLLYVGPGQINFQVPFGINTTTPMVVTTPTGQLPALPISVRGSVGIFGVVNPDGTVNSQSNPAPTGSFVALYVTGLGAPDAASQDGAISKEANPAFTSDVKIQLLNSYGTLPVLYAGTAPSLINGLDQINVQLPARATPEVQVSFTSADGKTSSSSNQVYIYTH